MRIVRNIGYVKRRKRVARWASVGGFILLIGTFGMAFFPNFLLVAYGLLFVGFIIFNYGMRQWGKWSRNPRNDAILDERLQSLADRYTLIHYPQLGKQVVEHLLVHPGGVLVITVKELPGKVIGRGDHWRRRGVSFLRLFGMSGPQLGNPSLETRQAVSVVERTLEEAQLEVDVEGAIVFVNPLVELDVEDTDFPAMFADELPDYLRDLGVDSSIRPADREQLVTILSKGDELELPKSQTRRRPVRVKRRVA